MNSTRRAFLAGALSLAASDALVPQWAHADTTWKPTGPVRLLNGFTAGGSADVLCRILAETLRPILGQTVVVETRAGANGFIAAEGAARAAPDGQTIALATMSMLTISPQLPGLKLSMNVDTDLAPISSIAGMYLLLVAYPGAPFKTVPELIAYARANPGQVSYASAGVGSAPHLAGELFRRQAGIDIVHVPYKGGSQAMIDLQAGRVHILIGNMSDFLAQVQQGALRGIAFGGDRAAPALPDLPLIKQWLPDYNVTNWFGIVGPGKLPVAVRQALNAAFQKAMSDSKTQQRMVDLGAEVMSGSVAQFQQMIAADRRRWGGVIKAADIRV